MPTKVDIATAGSVAAAPMQGVPAETELRERILKTTGDPSKLLPAGIIAHEFGYQNLGASVSAAKLYQQLPGAAATFAQIGLEPLFRGSIIGLGLIANAAKTAGTCTFEVYVENERSGARLLWTTGLQFQNARFNALDYGFMALDEVDVRVTTDAAFTPTTVDLKVLLYLWQRTAEDTPI